LLDADLRFKKSYDSWTPSISVEIRNGVLENGAHLALSLERLEQLRF